MKRGGLGGNTTGSFLLLLLFVAGMLGASYSLYSGREQICSSLSAGNMDLVFSDLYIEEKGPAPSGHPVAVIRHQGKSIGFHLEDAAPGYSAHIFFELQNRGSIPVVFVPEACGDDLLRVTLDSDCLEAGEAARGQITITVGSDMEPGQSYDCFEMLRFEQADAASIN
jgi:hypothetical protein